MIVGLATHLDGSVHIECQILVLLQDDIQVVGGLNQHLFFVKKG